MLLVKKLYLQDQLRFTEQVWETAGAYAITLPQGTYEISLCGGGGAGGANGVSQSDPSYTNNGGKGGAGGSPGSNTGGAGGRGGGGGRASFALVNGVYYIADGGAGGGAI